ncbi:F510_1955 family glycosylhydrolase [Arthrobacter citreus]|uniref:F510_1955 family glycosylhydrolase n=1 Tax=Arthrobacter TaxID=1663 RepID=UPI001263F578|nr:exo-alpha-sialidase [Arthrobacter gandavensis]
MSHLTFTKRARNRVVLTAAALSVTLLGAGCAQQPTQSPDTAQATTTGVTGHVHGMDVDPESGRVLLAAHEGLFDITSGAPEKIGPTIDLMGFAPAGEDHFYASGHPGPGTDMPNPVGLIHSTDGGTTWEPLSLQGESDFHALTVTRDGIVGFDGQVRRTSDLETWETVETDIQPYNLSGTPVSRVVLATTEQGVHRSGDAGRTWDLPADAPILLLTTFADNSTAVGVAPDGTIQVSDDTGQTWEATGGTAKGQPAAMAAAIGEDRQTRIWVATDTGVEYSPDSGATFEALN